MHARLAPSASKRWVACPGSIKLSEALPSQGEDTSEAAAEGTAAHWYADRALRTGRKPVDDKAPNGVMIDDEMRNYVQEYLNEVEPFRPYFSVEEKVKVPAVHPDVWGTCDAFAVDFENNVIRVWDLKYGFVPVEAYENTQLLLYGAGVAEVIGLASDGWSYELTIVQPRVWHPDGTVRTWKLSSGEMSEHVRHIRAAAEEALGPNPQTHVGAQCKYCPARWVCPSLQTVALEAIETAGGAVPRFIDPAGMALELRMLRKAQSLMGMRITGLEAEMSQRIRTGTVVPGWTLESSVGREKWTRSAAEIALLGELFGINLSKEPDVITPNQARKAGMTADVIAQYSERQPGETKLVEINTKRAAQVFKQ